MLLYNAKCKRPAGSKGGGVGGRLVRKVLHVHLPGEKMFMPT